MKKAVCMVLCAVISVTSLSTAAFAGRWDGSDSSNYHITEDTARKYYSPNASSRADDDTYAVTVETVRGIYSLGVGDTKDVSSYVVLKDIRDDDSHDNWRITTSIEWKSDRDDVVQVDEDGVITALGKGNARVTATGWDSMSRKQVQSFTITVK